MRFLIFTSAHAVQDSYRQLIVALKAGSNTGLAKQVFHRLVFLFFRHVVHHVKQIFSWLISNVSLAPASLFKTFLLPKLQKILFISYLTFKMLLYAQDSGYLKTSVLYFQPYQWQLIGVRKFFFSFDKHFLDSLSDVVQKLFFTRWIQIAFI